MSDKKYNFYMQACDINGNPITPPEDYPEEDKYLFEENELETVFEGLRYVKCEGLNTIGKVKNIYTETYSDADRLRVFMPKEVKNEETVVTLTLVFVGEKRNEVRDRFNDYIRQGYHKYFDDARNKEFVFFIKDELPIGEEMWCGSTPYLKCNYKLQNIKGKTEDRKQENN